MAVAISLGGLSLQANAGTQTDVNTDKADSHIVVKGADGKRRGGNCGAGNCGGDKPDDEGSE